MSSNTPLIDSYMADSNSMMLEISVNSYLPIEIMEIIASYFEMYCLDELVYNTHIDECTWCASIGFFSWHCRGYADEWCTNKLAFEVFGGDKRVQSAEDINRGLKQRKADDFYDRMVDEGILLLIK